MREPEKLEVRVGVSCNGFLLILAASGHDFERHALPAKIWSTEAVHASDLAIERGIAGLHVRIPDQIRELLGRTYVGEVRRTAGRSVDGVAAVDTNAIRDDETLVVQSQWTYERNPEKGWIGVVVHAFTEIFVHLPSPRARIAEQAELGAVGIWRLPADQQSIEKNFCRPQSVGQRGRQRRHFARVENVDVRIRAAEQSRINGEKEPSRLELIVFDFAVDRLQRTIADGKNPIAHDVPFLLRENRLEPHRAELGNSLNAVIAARDSSGDVARGRRLERYVADLEPLDELTSLSLVIDRDVVGGVELALGVVIEIDVNPVCHNPSGLGCELKVHEWLERAATVRDGIKEKSRGAKRGLILLATELETPVELQSEISVLSKDWYRLRSNGRLRLRRQVTWIRRSWRGRGKVARCNLIPDGFHYRAHVLLERRCACGLDLRLSLPE